MCFGGIHKWRHANLTHNWPPPSSLCHIKMTVSLTTFYWVSHNLVPLLHPYLRDVIYEWSLSLMLGWKNQLHSPLTFNWTYKVAPAVLLCVAQNSTMPIFFDRRRRSVEQRLWWNIDTSIRAFQRRHIGRQVPHFADGLCRQAGVVVKEVPVLWIGWLIGLELLKKSQFYRQKSV